MTDQPTLTTDRLKLRPLTLVDALRVQCLAGDFAIADTTVLIPHPYPDGAAEQWIATHADTFRRRAAVAFGIEENASGQIVGVIDIVLTPSQERGQLGYWVGREYWGQGYCTEAGRVIVDYTFRVLNLHRVQAYHFARNPASGRVLQKIGMTHEGTSRGFIKKWGRFEDCEWYAILSDGWTFSTAT